MILRIVARLGENCILQMLGKTQADNYALFKETVILFEFSPGVPCFSKWQLRPFFFEFVIQY